MANLSEEARRRRFVGWLQVGGRPRTTFLRAGPWVGVQWPAPDAGATAGWPVKLVQPAPASRSKPATAPTQPPNTPPAPCRLQRRGHRWDDIKGLLRQLEKEDARQALDGGGEEE